MRPATALVALLLFLPACPENTQPRVDRTPYAPSATEEPQPTSPSPSPSRQSPGSAAAAPAARPTRWRLVLGQQFQIPAHPPRQESDRFQVLLGNTRGDRFTKLGPEYIEPHGPDGLSVSPTGRHIVRAIRHSRVEIATAANPDTFSRIATLTKRDWCRGIAWSGDGKELVFMIARQRELNTPAEDADYDLYLAKMDGTTPKRIKRYFSRDYLALETYDWVHRRVFWSASFGGGGIGKLAIVTFADGKVSRVAGMQKPGVYGRLHFNRDFTRAYAVGQGPHEVRDRLYEFTIATGKRRTLYVMKNADPEGSRHIGSTLMDRPRNRLLFTTVTGDSQTTHLMTLPGGRIKTLLDGEPHRDLYVDGWSPDGRYIWLAPRRPGCSEPLSVDEEHRTSYLMDLSTRQRTSSYQARHCSERARVIGWLGAG